MKKLMVMCPFFAPLALIFYQAIFKLTFLARFVKNILKTIVLVDTANIFASQFVINLSNTINPCSAELSFVFSGALAPVDTDFRFVDVSLKDPNAKYTSRQSSLSVS